MYSLDVRNEAIKLRKQGKTYSDINTHLNTNIPKSTFSGWFNNIVLTKANTTKLEKNILRKLARSRQKASVVLADKRIAYLENLKNRNLHLLELVNPSIIKMLLSILYLAEGAKHKNTAFLGLASSSPEIINFYLCSLKKCFDIDNSKFRVRIQHRADQDSQSLEKYWQKLTKINPKQFYPSYVDKRTKGKKTLKKDYKGVCTIYYFDTAIQLELEILANSVVKYIVQGR